MGGKDELRGLITALEARPLAEAKRRLPKAASRFIRRKIRLLREKGRPIKQAVAMAYYQARAKGLL